MSKKKVDAARKMARLLAEANSDDRSEILDDFPPDKIEYDEPELIAVLINCLDDPYDMVICDAIEHLYNASCKEALPRVRQLIEHESVLVRNEAAEFLGYVGDASDVGLLKSALEFADEYESGSILFGLVEAGRREYLDGYLVLLASKNDDVKISAANKSYYFSDDDVRAKVVDAIETALERETGSRVISDLRAALAGLKSDGQDTNVRL
jgi:HEAT repeat protein